MFAGRKVAGRMVAGRMVARCILTNLLSLVGSFLAFRSGKVLGPSQSGVGGMSGGKFEDAQVQ